MSKFNTLPKAKREANVGGGTGFSRGDSQLDLKKEFISIIFNSMLKSGSYYETETSRIKKIRDMVRVIKSEEFLLKAMVYTRTVLNLRSVSHVIACAILDEIKGNEDTKLALSMIMLRPDDATEIVALWNTLADGRNIPNSLRKATRYNLENKWDAYQLKKYYGNGKVKVSDLIKLTHPRDRKGLFKMALDNNLPAIKTAQTINAQGGSEKERSGLYIKELLEGKLGVMAALKNITKIVTHDNRNTSLPLLHKLLTNKGRIHKSKVLPFRFAQAYDAIKESNMGFLGNQIQEILEDGFKLSAVNMGLVNEGETVAVLLDASASMGHQLSSPFGIGKVMTAAILAGLDTSTSVGVMWATESKVITVDVNKPLESASRWYGDCGGGTNLGQAVDYLINENYIADVVIILTDMQQNSIGGYSPWGGERKDFNTLKKEYMKLNPNVKFIFWNLEGYGGAAPAVLDHGTVELCGFSEKMLEFVPLLMKDKNAIIESIMAL